MWCGWGEASWLAGSPPVADADESKDSGPARHGTARHGTSQRADAGVLPRRAHPGARVRSRVRTRVHSTGTASVRERLRVSPPRQPSPGPSTGDVREYPWVGRVVSERDGTRVTPARGCRDRLCVVFSGHQPGRVLVGDASGEVFGSLVRSAVLTGVRAGPCPCLGRGSVHRPAPCPPGAARPWGC